MDRAVLELLAFYQNEIRESKEAHALLASLGLTAPEVVEHFSLGYCSGKALAIASDEQYAVCAALGLAVRRRERFSGCLVVPVFDKDRQLVDLWGIRKYPSQWRPIAWQPSPRGLIGVDVPKTFPEFILTDNPLHAMMIRQHGYANVVALRGHQELKLHLRYFDECAARRVWVFSRKRRTEIVGQLQRLGIKVMALKVPPSETGVPREALEPVEAIAEPSEAGGPVKLESRHGRYSHFSTQEVCYRVESFLPTGAEMRVKIRADREGQSFLDQIDLASAGSRQRFARLCGNRIGVFVHAIESHLDTIADVLDSQSATEEEAGLPSRPVTKSERDAAMELLREGDLLEAQVRVLREVHGFVGEEQSSRLVLLVAASRLLDKPLGAVLRGDSSCGKSSLLQAACGVTPAKSVMNLSRLTPKALYFMPKQALEHQLLVCDEYDGLAGAEYALRTMMSNQMLSLALTTRESGRTPITRRIETPATVAVLVSSMRRIAVDNLSRFIEIRLDDSPTQTQRVIRALAGGRARGDPDDEARTVHVAGELLKPCSVLIPFGDALQYEARNVLARRQFANVVGLVSAHAALCQYRRKGHTDESGRLTIDARPEDYAAVHPLLPCVVDSFEENVSPHAQRILDVVAERSCSTITRHQVMDWLGWSYSKAYWALRELAALDLLVPDTKKKGVQHTYEVSPYYRTSGGISRLAPPEEISNSASGSDLGTATGGAEAVGTCSQEIGSD